jgi:DNA-binding NarL/FixJ family response regulator
MAATTVTRVPLHRPFTPREEHVVNLVAAGLTYHQIGEQLGISVHTVQGHVEQAATKIPGSLPSRARVVIWWRGGTLETLG